jgi:hypothetical protein
LKGVRRWRGGRAAARTIRGPNRRVRMARSTSDHSTSRKRTLHGKGREQRRGMPSNCTAKASRRPRRRPGALQPPHTPAHARPNPKAPQMWRSRSLRREQRARQAMLPRGGTWRADREHSGHLRPPRAERWAASRTVGWPKALHVDRGTRRAQSLSKGMRSHAEPQDRVQRRFRQSAWDGRLSSATWQCARMPTSRILRTRSWTTSCASPRRRNWGCVKRVPTE